MKNNHNTIALFFIERKNMALLICSGFNVARLELIIIPLPLKVRSTLAVLAAMEKIERATETK